MRIRRALVPLLLVATAAVSGCGGDDADDSASDDPTTEATQTGDDSSVDSSVDKVVACDLLSPDDVAAAVGEPVKEGVPSSGPAITGGDYTTCVWASADQAVDFGTATVTIYENAEAADSARQDDDPDVAGVGDSAFSGAFSSIWVYVGERSFFAQWYTVSAIDEENLPKSQALAEAVVDAL